MSRRLTWLFSAITAILGICLDVLVNRRIPSSASVGHLLVAFRDSEEFSFLDRFGILLISFEILVESFIIRFEFEKPIRYIIGAIPVSLAALIASSFQLRSELFAIMAVSSASAIASYVVQANLSPGKLRFRIQILLAFDWMIRSALGSYLEHGNMLLKKDIMILSGLGIALRSLFMWKAQSKQKKTLSPIQGKKSPRRKKVQYKRQSGWMNRFMKQMPRKIFKRKRTSSQDMKKDAHSETSEVFAGKHINAFEAHGGETLDVSSNPKSVFSAILNSPVIRILSPKCFKISSFSGSTQKQNKILQWERIVKELKATEECYISNLSLLVNDYMEPLSKLAESEDSEITKQDVQALFGGLMTIYRFHEAFYSKLRSTENIVQVFLESAQFMRMYTYYVGGYSSRNEYSLKLERRSKEFRELLERNLVKHKEGLQSLMIQPVQRIPRYLLLIKELLKSLPEDSSSEEHDQLQKAYEIVEKACQYINDAKKDTDAISRLTDISSRIDGCPEPIVKPNRRLISEISAHRKVKSSVINLAKPCFLFVLSDCLIWTSMDHVFLGLAWIENILITSRTRSRNRNSTDFDSISFKEDGTRPGVAGKVWGTASALTDVSSKSSLPFVIEFQGSGFLENGKSVNDKKLLVLYFASKEEILSLERCILALQQQL